jgi:peptidylprolyl isomerase
MRTRYLIASGLAALALTAAGCGDDTTTAEYSVDAPPATESPQDAAPAADRGEKPKITVPDGDPPKQLETKDLEEGGGPAAKDGDSVSVDYVGVAYSTGKEFDTSFAAGRQPFDLTLGNGDVIAGWDEGIVGMKVGGRRQLIIPPDKAYGAQGFPPEIKATETLIFVVDLVAIN